MIVVIAINTVGVVLGLNSAVAVARMGVSRTVAAAARKYLGNSVLEPDGSDAFIVPEHTGIEEAVAASVYDTGLTPGVCWNWNGRCCLRR